MRLAAALLAPLLLAGPPATALDLRVVALFRDKAMVEIDGERRLLAAGEASPEGVRLVRADAEAAVLEVNGARRSYPLGEHIASSYAPPVRDERVVRAWPDGTGMYRLSGSINGFPVRFLVDTGATHVAMSADEARRLGIDFRARGTRARARTAGGMVEAWQVRLDRVRVGDLALREVSATVIEGPDPREVLLGMSFLGRLDMGREGQALELRHAR